ncbi:MAG: MlaD family protein [Rhodothermaceae bacterium]
MFKNFKGARLGLFVFLGTALIFLAIFLVGNKDSLFSDKMSMKAYFSNVEGLRTGASVRLSGMDVGTVSRIVLIKNGEKANVEVTFDVRKEISHFVRLDSEASIETEGLVGAKILALTPGSTDFEIVTEGSVVKSKDPVNMAEIIAETQGIIKYTKEITKDFSEIVEKVNQGKGSIGLLVNDDQLYHSTVKITKSADKSLNLITSKLDELSSFVDGLSRNTNSVLEKLDTTIGDISYMIADVKKGKGFVGKMLTDEAPFDSIKTIINNLVNTTQNTQAATASFAENMEALKHNWLFKSYFEQRGYWNKADYEKEIDKKIETLKAQNKELEIKLKALQELQAETEK